MHRSFSAARRALLPVCLLIGVAGELPAQDLAAPIPPDEAVVTGQLPNGLRYFIRANGRPERRLELRLVVRAGSVQEDDDQLGLAHFVEHMAFNGTRRFPRNEMVRYLESIGMRFGADLNAQTTFDDTIYLLQVPTDSAGVVRTAFAILEDWAHGIRFESAEVERERGVVIEEWRGRRGADARIQDAQLPVVFGGSRYASRLPIGTLESLAAADSARLVRYYRDWYRPDLMAVVAVGDLDPAVVEALIREHFGRLTMPASPRPRMAYPLAPPTAPRAAVVTDAEAQGTSVGIISILPTRPAGTVGAWRDLLVDQVLARTLNGRLAELAQRADPPFLGAGGGRSSLVSTADAWSLSAVVADGAAARGLQAVLAETERLRRHGVTQGELDRARADILRSYERLNTERDQRPSGEFAGAYVNQFLLGVPAASIGWRYAAAEQLLPGLTLAEINAAARDRIMPGTPIVLVGAPATPEAAPPAEAELLATFDRVRRDTLSAWVEMVDTEPLVPNPPAPGRVARQQVDAASGIHDWTLGNGVRVLVKETDFRDDQILVTGFSPGGISRSADPGSLAIQLASAIAVQGGAGRFSATDLQKALAGKAVSIAPSIGLADEGISGQVAPRDLETFFELLWLYFTAPRADTAAYLAFRQQVASVLQNRGTSPAAAFQDTLQVTMAQHHPLASPLTLDRVDELDLNEAMAFYRERFADAGDWTFVFVGRVDPARLRDLAARWLGALPATRRDDTPRDLGLQPPPGVVERTVRRGVEPVSQAALVFHGPFTWSRAERFALDAVEEVLTLRLRDALRESLGATYGVAVAATTVRQPRAEYRLDIQFSAAPDRVDSLTRVVLAEVDRLRADGATAEEIARITETRLREREVALRENGFWVGVLESAARDGEAVAAVLAEQERLIRALTPAVVREAARRYLLPDRRVQVTLYPETSTP